VLHIILFIYKSFLERHSQIYQRPHTGIYMHAHLNPIKLMLLQIEYLPHAAYISLQHCHKAAMHMKDA